VKLLDQHSAANIHVGVYCLWRDKFGEPSAKGNRKDGASRFRIPNQSGEATFGTCSSGKTILLKEEDQGNAKE